ncbi:MAG: glycosyltransferase [Clostridia bacterium]|nr:glycosyltransferase [Clostridia bacterium]
MKTSIVILTYNDLQNIGRCVESIRNYTTPGTYEIVVVDNGSDSQTIEWLKKQSDIKPIFNDGIIGLSKGYDQGIQASEGDNILFLKSDAVVTHNWLDNLIKCLYSAENIGAVGPVTNKCPNWQTINMKYASLEQMHSSTRTYNTSKPILWEERLRLIGFCMLMKKSLIEEIGLLDEIFSPASYEDDDYSLRIRKAGYKLMLCKDTFIHNEDSVVFGMKDYEYKNLLEINYKKFKDKWGFCPFNFITIRTDITQLIDVPGNQPINVLQIGCQGGATLLDIKNKYPAATLYGVEKCTDVTINVDSFMKVIGPDVDNFQFEESFFDYIIITEEGLEAEKILGLVERLGSSLKASGQIIISVSGQNSEINALSDTINNSLRTYRIKQHEGYYKIISLSRKKSAVGNANAPIRIAFLSAYNPLSRYTWSGTFYYMYKMLQKYCGEVYSLGPAVMDKNKENRAFETISKLSLGGYYKYWHSIPLSLDYAEFFERKLSEREYDVIFAPIASPELAFLKTDIPIVYLSDATFPLLHNYYSQYSYLSELSLQEGTILEQLTFKMADSLIFSTQWAAQSAVKDCGADPAKVSVIPFGANMDFIPSREQVLNRNKSDKCKLLFVGVDWYRKGGNIALETLEALDRMGVNAELTICGCKPPSPVQKDNIKLIPFLDKNSERGIRDMQRLYRESDFFLMPTRAECFGIVFSEAAGFGLPSIATDTGGISCVVKDAVNGFTLPLSATGEEYAKVIKGLWEDDEAYYRLVVSSRQAYDESLNWDAWGMKAKEIIEKLI